REMAETTSPSNNDTILQTYHILDDTRRTDEDNWFNQTRAEILAPNACIHERSKNIYFEYTKAAAVPEIAVIIIIASTFVMLWLLLGVLGTFIKQTGSRKNPALYYISCCCLQQLLLLSTSAPYNTCLLALLWPTIEVHKLLHSDYFPLFFLYTYFAEIFLGIAVLRSTKEIPLKSDGAENTQLQCNKGVEIDLQDFTDSKNADMATNLTEEAVYYYYLIQ
ncbi:hypothetical protein RFI_36777, partial [Reticulomyxa filosa]